MFALHFYFELHQADPSASLRLWVDEAAVQDLHSEVELPLTREGNHWTACFQGEHDESTCLWVRLAIAGRPGSAWQLEVREASDGGLPLLCDSDQLVMPKEWLVATCHRTVSPAACAG